MIDDQLAPLIEEVAESPFTARRVEDIVLLHLDPGQLAPLGA
jgi:hypothetical protein